MYVPIIENVTRIMEDKTSFTEIQSSHCSHDGYKRDICDGDLLKRNSFFENGGLQIILYYDDLELCNPLGSRKSVHKLGLFYYTLANYSNRSQLKKVHLAAIARTQVAKEHMNFILRHILDDVRKLEAGHQIQLLGSPFVLKGSIVAVSADNPASCQLGGFKESGKAFRGCRQCMITELSSTFTEREMTLRNKDQHLLHCQEIIYNDEASKEYGVNSYSPLLELKNFDMCNGGLIPDVMHDILEGVLILEVKFLLKSFIYEEKFFKISELNTMIDQFEYGYMEIGDKPSQIPSEYIRDDSRRKLGQSASQMWLLGRLLPLMVGHLVPKENSKWKNFLLLLKIMGYLLSPVISDDDCIYLKHIIEDHHKTFTELHPNVAVIPKMHYMVHMPRLMMLYGPLVKLWTMRFEAKHQYFKRIIQKTGNFINVAKTLATRHQMMQVYYLVYSESDFTVGPVSSYTINSEDAQLIGAEEANVQVINWIQKGSILFKPKCLLLYELADCPVFIFINRILMQSINDVSFVGKLFTTEYISNEFHCYVLNSTGITQFITMEKTLNSHYPEPLHLRYCDILLSYVAVPKHHICFI